MSEHQEQVNFFNWVRRNRARCENPGIKKAMNLCYAIPNGLSTKQGQKAKMEGLTKGIPDICLPIPSLIWTNLYIEMKFGKNQLSKDQKIIRDLLTEEHSKFVVCRSAKEAIETVMDYLSFSEEDYIPPKYL